MKRVAVVTVILLFVTSLELSVFAQEPSQATPGAAIDATPHFPA